MGIDVAAPFVSTLKAGVVHPSPRSIPVRSGRRRVNLARSGAKSDHRPKRRPPQTSSLKVSLLVSEPSISYALAELVNGRATDRTAQVIGNEAMSLAGWRSLHMYRETRRRRGSGGTVELDQGGKTVATPRIVSAEEWQQERNDLLKAEKEATRELDALPHGVVDYRW